MFERNCPIFNLNTLLLLLSSQNIYRFFVGEKSQQIVVIVKIYISNYFKFVQGHFFQYNYIGSTEDLILHPRKSSI